ncbi:MAG: hypothetical protein LUD84_03970 [Clostridiales bacterium]|nr:hypothetical protein [Clostridiales bacterium]
MFGVNYVSLYLSQEREAALYYLYMMADGRISYSEERMFGTLCNRLKLEESWKKEVIDFCKLVTSNNQDMLSIIKVESSMGEIRDTGGTQYHWWLPSGNLPDHARMIWNLVNLGYADTDYSKPEQEIVHYLLDTWKIPKVLYQEMIATADTMAALTKQRGWVLDTYTEGPEQDEKLKRIDEAIDKLHRSIKISIQELAM